MLNQASHDLAACSATPRLDAEVLLAQVLNVERSYLLGYSQQIVAREQQQQFSALLQRRLQGEPIAYLVGYKEFWSLILKVTPAVLIPRPETELAVELALTLLPANEAITVADLGTGSGAIALALAHERPHWQIVATDLSPAALSVAQHNAKRFNITNIEFFAGNWCHALPERQFQAIISNPPYIDPQDAHLQALQHEPLTALTAADAGYADLAQIIAQAPAFLVKGGLILLEHGYNQGISVANKLYNAGFNNVKIHRDLAGHERITIAAWQ